MLNINTKYMLLLQRYSKKLFLEDNNEQYVFACTLKIQC